MYVKERRKGVKKSRLNDPLQAILSTMANVQTFQSGLDFSFVDIWFNFSTSIGPSLKRTF